MTDILTQVMTDLRDELAVLPLDHDQVADITDRVEQRHRQLYGGDETYIGKRSDFGALREQMAEQVAAGKRVEDIARKYRVHKTTVYAAVRKHAEKF